MHLRAAAVSAATVLLATAALAAPQSRPFKARLVLTETIAFHGAAPCFLIGSVRLSGHATHLGRVTATSTDCINPHGVFDPSVPNAFGFASLGAGAAGLAFSAANGDQLFATYSGTLTPRPTGRHAIAGHFTITGGTGRFSSATGGGTLAGHEDLVLLQGELEADGTIAY